MDSSAKAYLLTRELEALRAGHNEQVIEIKEIELDGAIVRAIQCQESGCGSPLWPFNQVYEHDRYLRKVAEYRKNNPPRVRPSEEPERGMYDHRPFAEAVQNSTRALLDRYGR